LLLPSGGTAYALRLRLVYNQTSAQSLGVVDNGSNQNFPSQGDCFDSTASLEDLDVGSRITRRVQQCQFHKALPGIFDYALFSEGDLIK